ncbi:hypothetical protein EON76_01630 [bacterium]|nr:MAG: hypothetical protein EON76_01630 [bacterium]
MAVYKVPQDVEADDKLIGPFSFRQFIYLIVVAISMAGAWGLYQVFIPLVIVPIPIIIFFAALALPLRKDQPMETYLSAVVSFYFLKSRKRMWQPDGIDSFVTIIPPKDSEKILTKQFGEDEATRRLGYLADLVDSHGWSVRGEGVPTPDTSISSDLYYESQATGDMMDTNNAASQRLTQGLQQSSSAAHQNAMAQMQQYGTGSMTATAQSNPLLAGQPPINPAADQYDPATPFNPTARQQSDPVQPTTQSYLGREQLDAIAYAAALTEEATEERASGIPHDRSKESTSITPTSDGTIERAKKRAEELAKRDDLKVSTLAEEANRLAKKDLDQGMIEGDEVTISLR